MRRGRRRFLRGGRLILLLCLVALPLSLVGIHPSKSSPSEEPVATSIETEISTDARDRYTARFMKLQKGQKWREMVALGESALEEGALSVREQAQLHSDMTSCYYYLGDFCAAGFHAMNCISYARAAGDSALEVLGLVKQAGVERARANRKLHGSSFRRAISMSEEALHLYRHRELDAPLVLAKVYYNLGASCADDPCGHFAKAANAYQEALAIYRAHGGEEEVCRTAVRFALCNLQMGHLDQAEEMLTQIARMERSERVQGHYEFVWAQLCRARGKPFSARQWGERALERARGLDARADLQRIQAFLSELDLESDSPVAIR